MRIELTTRQRRRFEAKIDRSGGPDACHPWTGCRHRHGYGKFRVGGRVELAHRVAWCLAGNEITEERPCILHSCPGGDLPACVNERHLWAGTQADNTRDMAIKARGRKSDEGLPFGANRRPNGRFAAQAQVRGKNRYLGVYETAEEASAAATEAKTKGWNP